LSNMDNVGEKFMFIVPAKVGVTSMKVQTGFSAVGYVSIDMANYLDNPITVTITSISADRVAGTFSGTYTLSQGTGNSNSKKSIVVASGKFDIPFSTSADWKKLYHAE